MPEPLDLPDAGMEEAGSALTWKLGNPYWVGRSTAIRYRFRGRVDRLRAHFVRSAASAVPTRTTSIAIACADAPERLGRERADPSR